MIRVWRPYRSTRNWLFPINVGRRRYLIKWVADRVEADAAMTGHALLHDARFPVTGLLAAVRAPIGAFHVFERVEGADGRCMVFGDLLDAVDLGESPIEVLDAFLDEYFAVQRAAIVHAATRVPLGSVTSKLFADRARTGGRLDTYYGSAAPAVLNDGSLSMDRLAASDVYVNGSPLPIRWNTHIRDLRRFFKQETHTWAAVLPGDPTEDNIGVPYVEFDYDTAGLNALPAVWAVFLSGLLWLGGGVVPSVVNTERRPNSQRLLARNLPDYDIRTFGGAVYINLVRRCAPARLHTAHRFVRELVTPISELLGFAESVEQSLRPFVAMRAIGVFDLRQLPESLRVDALVRFAQAMTPEIPLSVSLGMAAADNSA